jgi:hypothetical protein
MGQLDKTNTLAYPFAQNLLLPPTMWQHLLGTAHDVAFLPYEQAEIEEYSWELDEAEEAEKTLHAVETFGKNDFQHTHPLAAQ